MKEKHSIISGILADILKFGRYLIGREKCATCGRYSNVFYNVNEQWCCYNCLNIPSEVKK